MKRYDNLLTLPLAAPAVAFTLVCLIPSLCEGGQAEGFTEPYHEIEVSSTAEPGLITAVNVREGQRVTANELLVEFDVRVLQASLDIARRRADASGRLVAARAEVELRLYRMEGLMELQQKGHASPTEIRRAATDLRVAQANELAAQEEQSLAVLECQRIEAQIEERRLRSPISGIVVDVAREVGETTQPSDPHMVIIVQLDRLKVKFPVSVQQAAELHSGDIVPVRLPEINRDAQALIEVVSPVLDAKSGTVEVTCVIDNSDNACRSGMRCLMTVKGPDRMATDRLDSFDRLDSQLDFDPASTDSTDN